MVTAGAQEALAAAFMAYLEPGDEVRWRNCGPCPEWPHRPRQSMALALLNLGGGTRHQTGVMVNLKGYDFASQVVLFEPCYPFMLGAIRLAGGVPRVSATNARTQANVLQGR